MRILVTGATGKIGAGVTRLLVERGDDVVALVRHPARAHASVPEAAAPVVGDVTDPSSLRRAAEGCEAVVNCMGLFEQWVPDPAVFDRVNAEGARNVVVAARDAGARRVVHTSTIDVFDAEPGGTVSERALATHPKGTAYERSKQRAEELVLGEADGIEVVLVNPASVYGPGPWAEAGLDSAIRDAIRRRLPALPPGGMSLVFADDAARAHVAALDRGRAGERYVLAGGYASAREIVAIAVDEAGRGWVPPTIPAPAARGLAIAGEGIARLIRRRPLVARGQVEFLLWRARADSTRARDELGVEFVAPDEGIRRTVRWMIETARV